MKRTITPGQISQNNRKLIYQYIYENGPVSQQDISYELRLSRPTISSKINELEAQGLIQREGQIESELVGRKAAAYLIAPDYRVAIGVEILKKQMKLLVVDLKGNYFHRTVIDLVFENTDAYVSSVCDEINRFIAQIGLKEEQILGIGIAIPGLVNAEGDRVTYGKILDCTGLSLDKFSRHLKYPCRFLHDANAAAGSEVWASPELSDFFYLNISVHLGAAIIQNKEMKVGLHGYAATIEHISINPKGKQCYCGKCGCIETYCSMSALLGGEEEDIFFEELRKGKAAYRKRWINYLQYLAQAVNNAHLVHDMVFVIGGYLASYFQDEDIEILYDEIEKISPFPEYRDYIRISKMPKHNINIGAALPYIREFLDGELI